MKFIIEDITYRETCFKSMDKTINIPTCFIKSVCGRFTKSIEGGVEFKGKSIGDAVDYWNTRSFERLYKRLSKIGIDIKLSGNYPWVYLDEVNGNKVEERQAANHGFCIAFSTKPSNLVKRRNTFKIIRKYLKEKQL